MRSVFLNVTVNPYIITQKIRSVYVISYNINVYETDKRILKLVVGNESAFHVNVSTPAIFNKNLDTYMRVKV